MKPLEKLRPLKHVAIADQLRAQIRSGKYEPGHRLPSLAKLQSEFGTSEDTVERVYALLERERLVVRKHRSGTFVIDHAGDESIAALACNGVVGVMIPRGLQKYSYYARILSSVQNVMDDEGIELLLPNGSLPPRWEKLDGIISVGVFQDSTKMPENMPAVSLLHQVPSVHSVVSDETASMTELVEHLLKLGHRRIGYLIAIETVSPDLNIPTDIVDRRLSAYNETLRKAGIEPSSNWLRPLVTQDEVALLQNGYADDRALGRNAMTHWLADGWSASGCTALLAQNDLVAIGAIEALRAAGIRVPQDVSVAGFDGLEIGDCFSPRLTTVEVPLEEIAAAGARTLLTEIRRPLDASTRTLPATTTLPAKLKVGESTAPLQ